MKRPLDQWEPTSVGIGQRSRSRRPLPTVRCARTRARCRTWIVQRSLPIAHGIDLVSFLYSAAAAAPVSQRVVLGEASIRCGHLSFPSCFLYRRPFTPRAFRRAALNYPSWKQLHSKAETQVSSGSIFALFPSSLSSRMDSAQSFCVNFSVAWKLQGKKYLYFFFVFVSKVQSFVTFQTVIPEVRTIQTRVWGQKTFLFIFCYCCAVLLL